MNDWNWHGLGMHGTGWIFWIIILLVVAWVLIQNARIKKINNKTKESPLEILKKRYARGEISKEEFEEAKMILEK